MTGTARPPLPPRRSIRFTTTRDRPKPTSRAPEPETRNLAFVLMHLSGLFIYPVKSLRGTAVGSASVDTLGLVGDRRFLVVDEQGRHLTQRPLPRMALVATALRDGHLVLRTADAGEIAVPLQADPANPPPLRTVSVWKSEGLLAEDCGPDAARFLSSFLGVTCHLVRIGEKFRRPVLDPRRATPADVVHFGDAYPFLVVSEASLADLNDRIVQRGEDPVPMDRFRPNLVIAGSGAFAEDAWPRVRIGEILFRAGGPCARCIVTTTDQHTGERAGKEPLRTLATYRRDAREPADVNFGQNLIHESKSGRLSVGDLVTPV